MDEETCLQFARDAEKQESWIQARRSLFDIMCSTKPALTPFINLCSDFNSLLETMITVVQHGIHLTDTDLLGNSLRGVFPISINFFSINSCFKF